MPLSYSRLKIGLLPQQYFNENTNIEIGEEYRGAACDYVLRVRALNSTSVTCRESHEVQLSIFRGMQVSARKKVSCFRRKRVHIGYS